MKMRIYALSCIMLFLLAAIPACTAQETVQTTAKETMTFAYVVVEGNTTPLFVGYRFIGGFGLFKVMIAKLDTAGHVEISKLSDPSENIVVDGSRIVNVVGFIGHLRWENGKLIIYGVAIFVSW